VSIDRAGTVPLICWHRDLPPLDAEPLGEHVMEATSMRVRGDLAHRDELWGRCHDDLMARARDRLAQEIARLGGDCAHVLEESIDSRHDEVAGEAFLHGRFRYLLLRRAAVAPVPASRKKRS
jgi:hypothetical protein